MMRGRVAVSIPEGTTAHQLAAVASVLAAIGAGRWEHLARSFTRMDAGRAVIAPSMAAILDGLSEQLRQAGEERAELGAELIQEAP
jgi:hypothetical protein